MSFGLALPTFALVVPLVSVQWLWNRLLPRRACGEYNGLYGLATYAAFPLMTTTSFSMWLAEGMPSPQKG